MNDKEIIVKTVNEEFYLQSEQALDEYVSCKNYINGCPHSTRTINRLSTILIAAAAAGFLILASHPITAWISEPPATFVDYGTHGGWVPDESIVYYGNSLPGDDFFYVPNVYPKHWVIIGNRRDDSIHFAYEDDQTNKRAYYDYTETRRPSYIFDEVRHLHNHNAGIKNLEDGNVMVVVQTNVFTVTIAGNVPLDEMLGALESVPVLRPGFNLK